MQPEWHHGRFTVIIEYYNVANRHTKWLLTGQTRSENNMLTRNSLLLVTLSCVTSFAYAQVPLPTVKILTTDPGTGPEDRDMPFLAWHEDLTTDGYEEIELQLSGFANIYEN
jgi:hypothetical protein